MQLLVAARKAEAELGDSRKGTVTIKAKAATTNDELVSLKQQVSDLVAVVKANHVRDSTKKITQQNDQRNDIKNRRAQTLETNRHFNNSGSSRNNQSMQPLAAQYAQQCYHCWGWGHMAKECATPLNYSKWEFQCPFPPKSKKSKRTGIPTNSTQTDSITLKAIREEYHNPDPIAQLIGKVNETCLNR